MILWIGKGRHFGRAAGSYIFYNALLWCLVCLVALLLLGVVRDLGSTFTARHKARAMIEEAGRLFEENAVYEASRNLTQAMATAPETAREIVLAFDERLIGLPGIQDQVSETLDCGEERNAVACIHHHLLLGDWPTAYEIWRENPNAADADGDTLLWLARAAMDEGQLGAAARLFRVYWHSGAHDRQKIIEGAQGEGSPQTREGLYETGRLFFEAGLWEEAFLMFDSASGRALEGTEGLEDADLDFYTGVFLETHGNTDKAIARYEKVLRQAPNHWRAAKRLLCLNQDLDRDVYALKEPLW